MVWCEIYRTVLKVLYSNRLVKWRSKVLIRKSQAISFSNKYLSWSCNKMDNPNTIKTNRCHSKRNSNNKCNNKCNSNRNSNPNTSKQCPRDSKCNSNNPNTSRRLLCNSKCNNPSNRHTPCNSNALYNNRVLRWRVRLVKEDQPLSSI